VHWKSDGYDLSSLDGIAPRIDLVLPDITLAGKNDGYEVLENLRHTRWAGEAKIVAVTGHSASEDMRRTQEAGFDGFIGKPLDARRFRGSCTVC
jgi:CheY-like chemotaxis protein